jgi:hypothetical protein
LFSFPSFPSANGPDKQIVNRTLKSDRAVAPMVGKGMWSQPSLSRAEKKVPVVPDDTDQAGIVGGKSIGVRLQTIN